MKNLFKEAKISLWRKHCELKRQENPLIILSWETTLKCNLHCAHCASSCGPNINNKDELSTDEIKKTFTEIAEDFDAKEIMIAVTGGEPLLRKDIFEVMDYATSLGFYWGMVTNGTFINKNIIENMKRTKMSTISVSIDGLEKYHNKVRGEKTFQKATEGIKMLVDSKSFKEIEIITCISKKNIKEIETLYKMCVDLKVDRWRLFNISPIGRAAENKNFLLNAKESLFVLDFIKEKRKNRKKKPKVSFCDEGYLGLEYEEEVRDYFFYCWAGITTGSILYNGDVAACPIIPREHTTQGNIREKRFGEIWKNEYKMFRDRNWKKTGECKNCSSWDYCEGNSLHLWDFEANKTKLCNYNHLKRCK